MIIEGRELRDQLDDWPLGTKFKCVGHWGGDAYYYEGLIYSVVLGDEEEGRLLYLAEGADVFHKDYRYWNAKGNGYSGIWQLISTIEGKELEDYL